MSSQIPSHSPVVFSGTPNDNPTKNFVLSCIDPRFAYATEKYLYDKYTANNQSFDHFVLAGGALGGGLTGPDGCNILSATSNWNKTLKDHIQLAITLHNVKGVEILDHLNCGAYGTCVSGVTTGATADQGVTFHSAQYTSLAAGITGSTFFSHDNISGVTLGNVIFGPTGAGITGGYFDGYAASVNTTLIDYGGNSIRTEYKGTNSGAKVLVLGCIDPRYSSVLSSFLREYKDVQFIYDLFILAGTSIGVNQSYTTATGSTLRAEGTTGTVFTKNILAANGAGIGTLGRTWGPAFFDHLSVARTLHGITDVWVFDHLDCGAYKAIYYGDLSNPDSDVSPHVTQMLNLKTRIDTYTSPVSLGFKGYIIDVEGNINKYVDGTSVLDSVSSALSGLNSVSTPSVLIRDASDYTRVLKQSRLLSGFTGTSSNAGSSAAYNNSFSVPVDYRVVQSNQNRLSYNFGRVVCGCTGAFPAAPLGST